MAKIGEIATECQKDFAQLLAVANSEDSCVKGVLYGRDVQQMQERYNQWAGNLGALQHFESPLSLELRLQDAPLVRESILYTLKDLHVSIQAAMDITTGNRPNRVSDSSDIAFDTDLSEDDVSSSESDTSSVPSIGRRGIALAPTSEIQELVTAIKTGLNSLFKSSIFIPKVSPKDKRFKARQTEPFDNLADVTYVNQRYPLLRDKNAALAARLGEANARRRQYFKYLSDRTQRLSTVNAGGDSHDSGAVLKEQTEVITRENISKSAITENIKSSLFAETKATELPAGAAQARILEMKEDPLALSAVSFVTSNAESSDEKLPFPPVPEEAQTGLPFLCPYCQECRQLERQSSEYQWKKHVLRDLEPYICTFSSCGLDTFQTQHAWFEHELLVHRSRWFCSQCFKSFESSDRLERHISKNHHEAISDQQLLTIIDHSKRPVESIQPNECPFCVTVSTTVDTSLAVGEEATVIGLDEFRQHLGQHLEEVALFALPRLNHDDDCSLVSNNIRGLPDHDMMSKGFRWVRDDCGRGWSIVSRRRMTFIAIAYFLALNRALVEARSVFALVEICVKVLSLTVDYSTRMKSEKEDIAHFRLELEEFVKVLRSLHKRAQSSGATKLVTFRSLAESIQQCKQDLEYLQKKLEPSKDQKAMKKYGVRALQWPFESKQLHDILGILERYKSTFSTALNADQTSLILEAGIKLDLAEQDRCLSRLSYAAGANFDSNERENEPYCLPDTRIEILSQIMEWTADPCQKSIFWLTGMAGTGKSTIARTIARTLTEQKRLTANFFFSSKGRDDLSHVGKLFTTVAVQLAAASQMLKRYICESIAEDDSVGQQSMRVQWKKLIYQPISRLRANLQQPLILVFVFDALDECERGEDIRELLQLLLETEDLAPIQFRVLITSRPEILVRLGFRAIPENMHHDFVLDNIALPVIEHDIAIFLRHNIDIIRDIRSLPSDWPSKENFNLLVKKSNGLFIYASTVCRFLGDPRCLQVKRLEILLQGKNHEQSPQQSLGELYSLILESSVFGECNKNERDALKQSFQNLMGSIIVLFEPLSTTALKSLLPTLSKTIDIELESLGSLLDVPVDPNTPIRLYHPSFRDFLFNKELSDIWIDERKAHQDVAEQCLNLMSKTLKWNICQLESPDTPRHEIEYTVLNRLLPSQVQYACQHWVVHFQRGAVFSNQDVIRVYVFLQTHFLHWLEALSLMGKISMALVLINLLESFPELQPNPDLLAFLKDAKLFVLAFGSRVDLEPLSLYFSALISCPEANLVKRSFSDQLPQGIESLPKVKQDWTALLKTLKGHSSRVSATVFSPDGSLLASGSSDKTVRLWDPVTGDCPRMLEGRSSQVNAISFSPDSQLLASGSDDHTVRLWDPVTGVLRSTLEGHSSRVNAISFSPDGRLLASGSDDHTVRLWYPVAGVLRSTLEGHSSGVNAISFSPDGRLLASGSDDNTVRLWHPATGACLGTLEGHSDWVNTIVFPPGGQVLASGSDDNTIKLWDTATGGCLTTLRGHSNRVNTIVFSPDGKLLASGSDDNTIRLWDPATGACLGTLEGHSNRVNTIAFSPDGQLLASGSDDNTINLWDPIYS